MKPIIKRALGGLGAVVVVTLAGAGIWACSQASAYNGSMAKTYEVSPAVVPSLKASTDPQVIARGKHLAESFAACSECHGADLAGGTPMEFGPLGTVTAPNITPAAAGALYSDAELTRLIVHGVKKDGRSVTFMPAQEINWLPDSDLVAILSYVRSMPKVEKPNGKLEIGLMGKIMDRRDAIVLDVARRIDHSKRETGPATPSPTAEYGKYIARICLGCHGQKLSGGPIPGAPSSIPIPLNITSHESGLKDWTYEDFVKMLDTGVKKNGKRLDPFMPYAALGKMDATEKRALWEYLRSVPPTPFGNR